MHPHQEAILTETRRHFFLRGAKGIAGIALGSLLPKISWPAAVTPRSWRSCPPAPLCPKAKRCIYLHMMGAPPQMDLLDYKPKMRECTTRTCRSRCAGGSA